MKNIESKYLRFRPSVLAAALLLATGPAAAADVYLAAKEAVKPLPDGSTVPVWVYVTDVDGDANGVGDCWEAATDIDRLACVDGLAVAAPMLPGPRLEVPPGDPNLNVHLSNGLGEPTSVVIPGQGLPATLGAGPVWNDGSAGARTAPEQRVRSYVGEAAPEGGRESYEFTLARSGTFVYHSGTWPQKQVYMGLYGMGSRDAGVGLAYPGVAYISEATMFYSDIDPVLNKAVWCEQLGTPSCLWDGVEAVEPYTTSIDYHAEWFLVNGEPFVSGATPDIAAGVIGGATLLRLASVASETHVPTLQGQYMTIHAEDGFQYNWQDGGTVAGMAPREQYSVMLPALKAKDAVVVATGSGPYAVYDGNGYMTNPSDPNDVTVGDQVGGMLRFLSFAPNTAPVVVAPTPDPLTVSAPLCATSVPSSEPAVAAWLAAATATDAEEGALPVVNDAPAALAVGANLVSFTATDSLGLSGIASATVNVQETVNSAPVVVAPAALELTVPAGTASLPASDAAIAAWLGLATASDGEDGVLAVVHDAPVDLPAVLAPGATTTVTFTATDSCGLTGSASATVTIVAEAPVAARVLSFSTAANNSAIPGVPTPPAYNNADIYSYDGTAFARPLAFVAATGLNANVDALYVAGPGVFHLSFANTTVNLPGLGVVDDEDVVAYDANTNTWTLVFDGSLCGLDASNGQDIDAIAESGGTLYFSTLGGGNTNPVLGVAAPYDDADVYTWDGNSCGRALDATAIGLPGTADVDGLSVANGSFYMSFNGATTAVPGGLTVEDEDVVVFDGVANWAVYFDGTVQGLDASDGHDLDAIDVP